MISPSFGDEHGTGRTQLVPATHDPTAQPAVEERPPVPSVRSNELDVPAPPDPDGWTEPESPGSVTVASRPTPNTIASTTHAPRSHTARPGSSGRASGTSRDRKRVR